MTNSFPHLQPVKYVHYEQLIQTIQVGVVVQGRQAEILMCNPAALNLLGLTEEQLLGMDSFDPLWNIIKEDGTPFPALERPPQQALLTSQSVRNIVMGIFRPTQQDRIWITVNTDPQFGSDGELVQVVSTFHDIGDQLKARNEMLRASKLDALSLLAGGIAHDFNNLLTAVLGNISLAKLGSQENPGVLTALENAEKAGQQSRSLVQQLLNFAKGEPVSQEPFSLGLLLRETVQFVLHGSKSQASFQIPNDLWFTEGHAGQIGQVIQNLAINAIQAMPEGGKLSVQAKNCRVETDKPGLALNAGAYVQFIMQDEGSGIKEADLKRIFDPYFTTKPSGHGLGLAVCYSVIKEHQGLIEVTSQPGQGSTFTVYLPASPLQTADSTSVSGEIQGGQGRILVLDDDAGIQMVLNRLLGWLGYEVVSVTDSDAALKTFAESLEQGPAFDCVIIDLTLPGSIGGQEMLTRLRRLDPNLKAILSSGYADNPILKQYRDYGFQDVLLKPYNIDGLSQVLHRVLTLGRPG